MTAARPGLSAIANRAAELGASVRAALTAEQRLLLEATPIGRTAALVRPRGRRTGYADLPASFFSLGDQLAERGGAEWVASHQRLLICHFLAGIGSAEPALRIPLELEEVVYRELANLLDELPGYRVESWADDMFLKDLAVARLQIIPLGFFVVDVRRLMPRNILRYASRRERLAMLRYLQRGYFQTRPVLGTHAYRGFREPRRDELWQIRFRRLAPLLGVNPTVAAYFGHSWMTDPRIAEVSPRLGLRATGLVAMGGRRFRMATSAHTVEMALTASASRRKLYDDGLYQPKDHGIIVKRSDLLRWAESPAAHPERAL